MAAAAPLDTSSLSAAEQAEVASWQTKASALASTATADADRAAILDALDAHLATRTTLLGTRPSAADVSVFEAAAPLVRGWTAAQRTGEGQGRPHVVRLVDFVQNSPLFGLAGDKVPVDPEDVLYVKPPVDAKAEKERLKKEKAAAAAAAAGGAAAAEGSVDKKEGKKEAKKLADRTKDKAKAAVETVKEKAAEVKEAAAGAATTTATPEAGPSSKAAQPTQKREKKEKQPKGQGGGKGATPAAPVPLSPALIDLRVGHILKAIKHPEADSLYVSTIAMGDAAGADETSEYEGQVVRTVCSGLNGLVPLDEMQGRKVVVVCNLKPVKMRGIKSAAMVLAASPRIAEGAADDHKGPVELVSPPDGAVAGERVFFEGWKGEPEGVLNPKKKIWETFQPGFTTTQDLEVAFDAAVVAELGKDGVGKLVTETGGVCTVKSLKGATVR